VKSLVVSVLVCLASSFGPAAADTVAITNATIYQRADKKLDNATIVIRDGKIVDVGTVAVPAGAKVIDGRGKVVTAGLIEASTMLGLIEVDLEESGNDGRFGVHPIEVHAGYRASDAFDSQSVAIPVARAGGVTSAIVGPRGGLVSGQAALISLGTGASAPIKLSIAMQAALGPGAVQMKSRGYAIEKLRQLFDDVDAYRRNKAGFDRNQSRKLAAERLDLEALIPVLEGRQLLVVAADSDVDIRAALAIAAERKLKIAIAGGLEAWRLAKELAAAKVPVLLDPNDNLPGNIAAADVATTGRRSSRAGGGHEIARQPANARQLRQRAGNAVAAGLTWAQGLASITSVPAQIYGITDRGTLDRGNVGDVVVWSGDPLELSTKVETVIINGVVQSLESHQTRLRDRYRQITTKPVSSTPR
jgi:imidazolonepropionase-like amidohydrolase